jgi:hypothetical protein
MFAPPVETQTACQAARATLAYLHARPTLRASGPYDANRIGALIIAAPVLKGFTSSMRVAELLADTLHTVTVMTCCWRRTAMLVALLVAIFAVVGSLGGAVHAANTAKLACYIALAIDLKPLVASGLSDEAVASAECADAPASTKTSLRFAASQPTSRTAAPRKRCSCTGHA